MDTVPVPIISPVAHAAGEALPEIKPLKPARPVVTEEDADKKTTIQPTRPGATPAPVAKPSTPAIAGNGRHRGEKPPVMPVPPAKPGLPVSPAPVVPGSTHQNRPWLRYALTGGVVLLALLAGLYFINQTGTDKAGAGSPAANRSEAAIDTLLDAYSYADSCFEIGENHYYGRNSIKQNFSEAAYWYLKAADAGQSSAQNSIGYMYFEGSGLKKNYPAAVQWLTKSAEQANPKGQKNLAYLYQEGLGVKKDLTKAFELYRKAAESGLAVAQNSLGYLYDSGQGVAENNEQAVLWYRKAADQGDSNGQFNLGTMYEFGEGVPGNKKDLAEAKKWYTAAARQENKNARATLTKMGQTW